MNQDQKHSMTERPSRAVDLHAFAFKEFLEFVRREDPSWIEGAQSPPQRRRSPKVRCGRG